MYHLFHEGQFETYLFQKGEAKVMESIKKCWCSCFSERVMSHRLDCGLPTTGLKMAVVIQVKSDSGVGIIAVLPIFNTISSDNHTAPNIYMYYCLNIEP